MKYGGLPMFQCMMVFLMILLISGRVIPAKMKYEVVISGSISISFYVDDDR